MLKWVYNRMKRISVKKEIADLDLSDIIGGKIEKIEFSQRPESSYNDSPYDGEGSIYYSVNGGDIQITLNNGLVLRFGNSEWGGMQVLSAKSKCDNDFKDYTQEDIEDKL